MSDTLTRVYEAMRASPMSQWVGGGDSEHVGRQLFTFVQKRVPLRRDMRILDLGCGIGRSTAAFADYVSDPGRVVGIDVVESMVRFCNDNITSRYPRATFHACSAGDTYLPDQQASNPSGLPTVDSVLEREGPFDLVLAFSVFTHLLVDEMDSYLKLLHRVTEPGAHLVLSFFLVDPWVRRLATSNGLGVDVGTLHERSDGLLVTSIDNPRAAVLIPTEAALGMAGAAGFHAEQLVFGSWRSIESEAGQDTLVLRRPAELPQDFDSQRYLEIHPDVASAGMDAAKHYMLWGRREGRRYR